MMEREVRYCTTEDGVRIAYCVEGEGPPLVVAPYLLESFSLHHLYPAFDRFMRMVGRGRSVIRYDVRSSGLSQRDVEDVSHSAAVQDLDAVVLAAGLQRFALFGPLTGGPVAITYTHQHPDRVSRLALYGSYPGLRHFWGEEMIRIFTELARANWPMASRALGDLSLREDDPAMASQQADMLMQSIEGDAFANVAQRSWETNDVISLLPEIPVPTLIVHRVDDAGVPFHLAQKMASDIPNSRLVALKGRVNQPAAGDSQAVIDAINSFLDEDPATRRALAGVDRMDSPTAFRTVLVTDVVGHTEMMQRLGDQRGRDVLREHERITRDVLRAHGGTEVKTMGDGFMASFGSVTRAVECAVALQRAFEERNASLSAHPELVEGEAARPTRASGRAGPGREPLSVRIGLNAGEPIEEEGDLFGSTVILAARIAARADGGEILASDVVRGLCSGKGFLFADRGEFVAKGFEEPVRLFEVSWRPFDSSARADGSG
jgi:class 3 adenylate cyclase/alpha-beta hydrolase superfamily lysophospholipase